MTHEIQAHIEIDGIKVAVGHKFLEDIAYDIPDISKHKKVFEVLAKSSNFELREIIADKTHISKKTVSVLLNDSDQNVIEKLLKNRQACKKITQEQMDMLLDKANDKLLCTIAENIDDFHKCNIDVICTRLLSHNSSTVRYEFLNHSSFVSPISVESLKKLSMDTDFDVAAKAQEELKSYLS